MTQAEIERKVNGLMLKDLRVELRARGLSPAGGLDALRERLSEAMVEAGSLDLVSESGNSAPTPVAEHTNNNYVRPEGQNVGNFITDRPSSKVLAAPGGNSQISFGWGNDSAEPEAVKAKAAAPVMQSAPSPVKQQQQAKPVSGGSPSVTSVADIAQTSAQNNYARPSGQQNVGNFITDRPSSRVINVPGGASQISFG